MDPPPPQVHYYLANVSVMIIISLECENNCHDFLFFFFFLSFINVIMEVKIYLLTGHHKSNKMQNKTEFLFEFPTFIAFLYPSQILGYRKYNNISKKLNLYSYKNGLGEVATDTGKCIL